MALVELLGPILESGSGDRQTAEALEGKQAVALYFSAHWCPPCRGFTPKLAEFYKADLQAKGLEVVFVSSDRDEGQFKEYFAEMPWLSLPYSDREKKEALSKKYKVNGIPALIVLDANGVLITNDGRTAVMQDPVGENFPWVPRSVSDVLMELQSAKFLKHDSPVVSFQDLRNGKKALALYFSAHWCGPCRGFTPTLAASYNALSANGLEVIFVSWDRTAKDFKSYWSEQPWLALDYEDRKLSALLKDTLKVDGIPSLIILDPSDLSVITDAGRAAYSADPEGLQLPWRPKAVQDLAQGPGKINDAPMVVAFCESCSAAEQSTIEETLTPLAERYLAESQAGEDAAFYFMLARKNIPLAWQIRQMLGLPSKPAHEHPLKLAEGANWGCDGCRKGGSGERWRCTEGCDFDFCSSCHQAATDAEPVGLPPRLGLIDIPDSTSYYLAPEDFTITTASVEKFLDDFKKGRLEKRSLS